MNIRIDENIKRDFDAFCSDVGINPSAAVNMFARAVLRERRIPFEITNIYDPFYSKSNQVHLNAAIERIESGLSSAHELIEADDD
jgi:DNA-damage-inducible protein J